MDAIAQHFGAIQTAVQRRTANAIGTTAELPRTINTAATTSRRRRAKRAVRRGLREALLWGALGPHRRQTNVCARVAPTEGRQKKSVR